MSAGTRGQKAKAPKLASSRTTRWRIAVLVAVHLAIFAHILHWRLTGTTMTPLEPSEGMELAKHDVVNAGLLLFLLAGLATAVFGRFFCGWGCHLLALQDLAQGLLRRIGIRPQPLRSRLLLWVPVAAFIYMFLWPAIYRLVKGLPFGPLRLDLYTSDFWATFPGPGVAIFTFAVCGFVIVFLLGGKGFCTYACPYGALFGFADRFAPLRIRVTDGCNGCGHCTASCTSNVLVHAEVRDYGAVVDPGCMKCLDCVSVCPNDALYLGFGLPAVATKPRVASPKLRAPTHSWRQELLLAAAFTVVFFSLRGLYGVFPFLLALGLAGCLAFLVLIGSRLLTTPDVALRRWVLQRAGKLTAAGRVFVTTLIAIGIFVAHSAWLQYELARGQRQMALLGPARAKLEGSPVGAVATSAADQVAAAKGLRHLDRIRRFGLLADPRAEASLPLAAFFAGRGDLLETLARDAHSPATAQTAWMLRARDGLSRRDSGLANHAYRAAIAAAPTHSEAPYLELGQLLAEDGNLAVAGEVFAAGRAAVPGSAPLAYNQALVFALQGSLPSAEAGFRQALALDPEMREARENLAGLLAATNRPAASVEQYRQALARNPNDRELRLELARNLAAAGRFEAARDELQVMLGRDPLDSAVLQLLAELGEPSSR